jgi:hypothetical protein
LLTDAQILARKKAVCAALTRLGKTEDHNALGCSLIEAS